MFGRDDKVPQFKLTVVQYAILGIFLLLAYGLWRLQVGGSDYYEKLAEQNRIRNIPVLAPRGRILDREGRVIVDNYPSFSALLLRDQNRDLDRDVDMIASALHMEPDEVRDRLKKFIHAPQYQPIILKDDITPEELAFIESHHVELPELDTIMSHRRLYPKNGFLAHLIGYVGEVSEDMLNTPQWEFYNPGDVVGKSGVELQYNDWLMGKNGYRRAIVDSRGKEVGHLDETPAIPGRPLRLSIDIDLQIAAEQAMEGKNGAVLAMDPRNGQILAMVSRPNYDPNAFAVRITKKDWSDLVNDPAHPLLNKAIQAQLAPGSVFKIIMAVAGMQEGISQTMVVHCGGGGTFYGRFFKCWVKSGHGTVTIQKAIYQSCDTYFYTLAERLGIGRIASYATAFGLGQKTGIDLPQEVSGVMPSEEWKIKNFKQKWFAGETISVGIGQGAVATTPIQLARAIGGITMGGVLYRPTVVMPDQFLISDQNAAGGSTTSASFAENQKASSVTVPIDPQNWEIITDAMANVVNPGGTAPSAHLNNIDFAGKTGSAQTISNALKSRMGDKSKFKDNGWFVGVTPRRNPEIVVAVLVEEGEHGYLSARLGSQIIKAYVEKQRTRDVKLADRFVPGTAANNAAVAPSAGQVKPAVATPETKTAPPAQKTDLRPAQIPRDDKDQIEIAGAWTAPDDEDGHQSLKAGRFRIKVPPKSAPLATVAPGLGR